MSELLLNLAEKLHRDGRTGEAEQICVDVLRAEPDHLEALYLLGAIYSMQGRWEAATACYARAVALAPELAVLQMNLGVTLMETGRTVEALAAFDRAVHLKPTSVTAHQNRGLLLQRLERLADARASFEQVLALDPVCAKGWINLSAVCLETHDDEGAAHCCYHGLRHVPDDVALLANLATACSRRFRFDDAIGWNRRLLEMVHGTERAEVLGRIANALSDNGQVDDAVSFFDAAVSVSESPCQQRALASTRLFVLHYSALWSSSAIAEEHRAWGKRYFPTVAARSFGNSRDLDRPVRVAYLSPDFKIHAVVFFLQPVLAAHDPAQISVFCYSDVSKPDVVTRQLKDQHPVVWRDVSRLDDAAVEKLLQEDRIDILVDLAGHTGGNRLPLFARRVAPLQITWIGYPNGTGLQEMDYRITDPLADPPGITDCYHIEKLLRMPDCFLCYRPGADFPEAAPPPHLTNRYITFGSFSNFKKVTTAQLDLWASILAAVPASRLLFRARGMTAERFQRDIAPVFQTHHVDPTRITVLGHARSVVENLEGYALIDIALDTFPYHGTTTTCEALCMGVPVVTLAGDSHVSRVGVSLLSAVGLTDLIAGTPEQYLSHAVGLASDLQRLQILRESLRQSLLASSLTDNVTFTRNLESVYRAIWQRWCQENSQAA